MKSTIIAAIFRWIFYILVIVSAASLEGDRTFTWQYWAISLGTMAYGFCMAYEFNNQCALTEPANGAGCNPVFEAIDTPSALHCN